MQGPFFQRRGRVKIEVLGLDGAPRLSWLREALSFGIRCRA
jgi:hypothetical protein